MSCYSGSAISFRSMASNVTRCSNSAFQSVLSRSWTNSTLQKDVLVVLTAVTKIIQDKGGSESSSEYYAALLSILNSPTNAKSAEVYLLKLVMCKAVPDNILRATFSEAGKILMNLLSTAGSTNLDNSLTKSILICLGRLLRAQTGDSWSTESVRHVYRHLLHYCDDKRPNIRKACHSAIVEILNSTSDLNHSITQFHPAIHQTQEHICSIIRQEMRQLLSVLHTRDFHCTKLLHCLELLTLVLPTMSSKEVKVACECILELVEFPNPLVGIKAFGSIRSLFASQPCSGCLSADLGARLLTALYANRPTDPTVLQPDTAGVPGKNSLTIAWIEVVRAGCSFLCRLSLDPEDTITLRSQHLDGLVNPVSLGRLAGEHLDRLIKCLLDLLSSTPVPSLKSSVAGTLDDIFVNELDTQLVSGDLLESVPALLPSIATKLNDCLNLQTFEAWRHVLVLTARLLRLWPVQIPEDHSLEPRLRTLLEHVVKLRDSLVDGPQGLLTDITRDMQPDSRDMRSLSGLLDQQAVSALVDEMDRVCLVALETRGPIMLLEHGVFSLHSIIEDLESGRLELRRSWILPLLTRVAPKRPCKLGLFVNGILPLADRALGVAQVSLLRKDESTSSALIAASITVARQLWGGLNMFVRHAPLDWTELSTGGLGRRLVNELNSSPALRSIILRALRRLACVAVTDEIGSTTLRGGAKLAVPAMLSLYENSDPTADRSLLQQIRSTLGAYLPCLNYKMVAVPVSIAVKKLETTKQPVYMELLQILVPHISTEDLLTFIPKLQSYLSSESCPSRVIQKRAYRLLELVSDGTTNSTAEFVSSQLNCILDLLHSLAIPSTVHEAGQTIEGQLSNLTVSPKSKRKKTSIHYQIPWKPRMRCIQHLFKHLVTQELSARKDEALDCTLFDNVRLRNFANMFLPEILAALCEANTLVRQLAGRLLVNLVMAFAGQSPSASIASSAIASVSVDNDNQSAITRSTYKSIIASSDVGSDDDNDGDTQSMLSTGMLTCVDEDDLMSTKSMPHISPISYNICRSLNMLLSRLWGFLPPHASVAASSAELSTQVSAAFAICQLLKHVRFRRALSMNLRSESDDSINTASGIINEACEAAQHLVKSVHRPLARTGLQLTRLLMAFVGYGSVALKDLLQVVQSLHETQKNALRFAVKAILEKMIKKYGRHAIQSMCTSEYQKVVRNSARTMARQERQTGEAKSQANEEKVVNSDEEDDDEISMHSCGQTIKSKTSGPDSVYSSHLSLPSRVHIPRLDELLAQSSDEEDIGSRRLNKAGSVSSHTSGRERSNKAESIRSRGRSLVDELESVAETQGLCRRARQRMLGIRCDASSGDSSADDQVAVDRELDKLTGIRRKVRFADDVSTTSTNRHNVEAKRNRPTSDGPDSNSDLWLIENPETEEILDLSDPRALARHTTLAANAQLAKTMTGAFNLTTHKKKHSTSSLPFPIVDGKIVIDAGIKRPCGEEANGDETTEWTVSSTDDQKNVTFGTSSWDPSVHKHLSRKTRNAKGRIPGSLFASTKAFGDMRRSGQPAPYAYLSLGTGLNIDGAGGGGSKVERHRLLRAVGVGKKKQKHRSIKRVASMSGAKPSRTGVPVGTKRALHPKRKLKRTS